jgi:protocatechuate 3,4-dioxygenase beta subunit
MKNRFRRTTGALFLFLAVCITAAVDSLYAQRAAVQGIVTDQQTGQPLEGANV